MDGTLNLRLNLQGRLPQVDGLGAALAYPGHMLGLPVSLKTAVGSAILIFHAEFQGESLLLPVQPE